jgi:MFS transporter, YNFM family, putative membrane transport protein
MAMDPAGTATTSMMQRSLAGAFGRSLVVALTAFFTLVDLFATQAILPSLTKHYGVTPAAMGLAVNASTLGMAVAGLAMAFVSHRIDRRLGILLSLCLLAIPTCLLAFAPNLATFAALRIVQGIFMATAFSLTLAYLGERLTEKDAAGAFAAYITGNVASNLVGRFIAAEVVNAAGLVTNFHVFALLNLLGAALVYFTVDKVPRVKPSGARETALKSAPMSAWREHLRNPQLRADFGIGFCILFAFIGIFTYVNFILMRPPLEVGMMGIGFIYLVFLPSIITTPLAGKAVQKFGTQATVWASLAVAGIGLPLLVLPSLSAVLLGMVLVGVGTFFAQAAATGFVSRAATTDRGSASGIYLASYFMGGLVGSAVLGLVFDRFGWEACVAGVGLSLLAAAFLTVRLAPASATVKGH